MNASAINLFVECSTEHTVKFKLLLTLETGQTNFRVISRKKRNLDHSRLQTNFYQSCCSSLLKFSITKCLLRMFPHYCIIIIKIVTYCNQYHILSITHYYFCLLRYQIFLQYYLYYFHICIISDNLLNYSIQKYLDVPVTNKHRMIPIPKQIQL